MVARRIWSALTPVSVEPPLLLACRPAPVPAPPLCDPETWPPPLDPPVLPGPAAPVCPCPDAALAWVPPAAPPEEVPAPPATVPPEDPCADAARTPNARCCGVRRAPHAEETRTMAAKSAADRTLIFGAFPSSPELPLLTPP